MKRTLFLICSLLLLVLGLQAQKLTVESMSVATNDISASTSRRMDLNGQPCGLVKVQLATSGAVFDGNIIKPVEYKTGEYWVYMTEGAYMLQIKHPNFLPLELNFRDYGIKKIQSLNTYKLVVVMSQTVKQESQKLTINYSPAHAMVLIDSKVYKGNGVVDAVLPVGAHDYIIAAEGYDTVEGTVKLKGGSPRSITERLNKTVQQQPVAQTVQQVEQQIPQQTVNQNTPDIQNTPVNQNVNPETVNLTVRTFKSLEHVSGPQLSLYSIVVGNFSIMSNAQALAQKLTDKGFSPTIIKDNTTAFYRVIISTTNDKAKAATMKDDAMKDYPSCWVLYNATAGAMSTTGTSNGSQSTTLAEPIVYRFKEVFDKNHQITSEGTANLEKVVLALKANPNAKLYVQYSIGTIKTKSAYKRAYYKASAPEKRSAAIESFFTKWVEKERIVIDDKRPNGGYDVVLRVQ